MGFTVLFVKTLVNTTIVLDGLNESDTVSVLKNRVFAAQLIQPEMQRLIFAGKQLCDDSATLSSVGLKDGNTVHLVLRLIGGGNDPLDFLINIGEDHSDEPETVEHTTERVIPSPKKSFKIEEALQNGGSLISIKKNPHSNNYSCHVRMGSDDMNSQPETSCFPNVGPVLLKEIAEEFPATKDLIFGALPTPKAIGELERLEKGTLRTPCNLNTKHLNSFLRKDLTNGLIKITSIEKLTPPDQVYLLATTSTTPHHTTPTPTIEIPKSTFETLKKTHKDAFLGIKVIAPPASPIKKKHSTTSSDSSGPSTPTKKQSVPSSSEPIVTAPTTDDENTNKSPTTPAAKKQKQDTRQGPVEFLKTVQARGTTVIGYHKGKKQGMTVVRVRLEDGEGKSFNVGTKYAAPYIEGVEKIEPRK
ncbi:ubiquitin-domain-containing protein [Rhizoclosmatium globosum]|uniref:Ubiquitin-domain-containing protein n=1 Tax=Rhizoclosmatium globosum TaxID=329046 RepID=A0A1Y2BDV6_9FUNG|nr:ubiquitin-domain-containing protein [Rhizoclosmatium globosum]|eukprot:ORY32993.1 ubiquitin-domain-containing protein [Rhizoclosmatium globosum]